MRQFGKIEKGWGSEEIWASNDLYCGKLMHFDEGAKFSMHFHAKKDETWYVLSGEFVLRTINTKDSFMRTATNVVPGSIIRNEPLVPHQLICVKAGTIIEVSTPDSVEDNYRILPGDSQIPKNLFPELEENG